MRRRLPSPALVVASIALFVGLGGAGFAASLALQPVRAAGPLVLVPGSVSADGTVRGTRVKGERVSQGVYTLTISGNTFRSGDLRGVKIPVGSSVTPAITISGKGVATSPPTCGIESEALGSNGSAKVEVDCFAPGPAGWQPTDAGFDFQISGPAP